MNRDFDACVIGSGAGGALNTVVTGGRGGGAVRLTAGGAVTVDGAIYANGLNGATSTGQTGGGGAGGSYPGNTGGPLSQQLV